MDGFKKPKSEEDFGFRRYETEKPCFEITYMDT